MEKSKSKNKEKISIRIIFIVFFICIISLVSLTIVGVNQYVLNKLLTSFAQSSIRATSAYIQEKVQWYFKPLSSDVIKNAKLIQDNVVVPEDSPEFRRYLITLIYFAPQNFGVLWTSADNHFYAAARSSDKNFIYAFNTFINNKAYIQATKYNSNFQPLNTYLIPDPNIDSTKRPSYVGAVQAKGPIWTGAYHFVNFLEESHYPLLGVTGAVPVYDDEEKVRGVLGLSLTAQGISDFISDVNITKNSIIFITDQNNNLIGASKNLNANAFIGQFMSIQNWQKLNVPRPSGGFSQLNTRPGEVLRYHLHYKDYFVIREPMQNLGTKNWFLTILVPVADILAPLEKILLLIVIATLAALLVSILFAQIISYKIAKPIMQLVHAANTIKSLNLAEPILINTKIKEIQRMAFAFQSMKYSLSSFQSYVPKLLVKKLVRTGEIAHIGGKKKKLTIMFTDLKGFTRLTEKTEPTLLTQYLSRFLETMTDVIIKYRGTIDKYIGDGIMAFWNAPNVDNYHAFHACKAALKMQSSLRKLNRFWNTLGFSGFEMRIGINTGIAVVGNIGSSARLNYTAIGDSVNLASRLVGANKIYNTKIIISANTFSLINDKFLCRLLDRIAVKGKEEDIYIYELLGKYKPEKAARLEEYQADFQSAFVAYQGGNWNKAIELFDELSKKYPNDSLSKLFIQRGLELKSNPPANWNGIWHLEK